MTVVTCAPVPPVFGLVQFSAAEFLTAYPEFTGIYLANPAALTNAFDGAQDYVRNSCCGRVNDANLRQRLLYLMTAHLLMIYSGANDAGVLAPFFSGTGSIAADTATLTIASVSLGSLAVGSSLYDGPSVGGSLLVPGGAIITALGTGTGGIGTYTLNTTYATAVAVESMIVPGVPTILPALGMVGRISDASEGDVSASAVYDIPANASAAYFLQTKYGADFWQRTARFRTAIFLPAPPSAYNPLFGYGIGLGGPGDYGG